MKSARLLVILLMVQLTACLQAPAGSNPPDGSPTPDAALAGAEGSSAVLVYDYTLSSDDLLYETRVTERLPVLFFIDPADPRAGSIVAGGQTGSERIRIQGLNQGVTCWAEITYTVQYDIVGTFDPAESCKLVLRVRAIPDHSKTVKGGDCPPEGLNQIAPEMLFIAPYEGPFEFASPYRDIEIDFGGGTRVTASLRDIRLPAGTGCP